MLRVMMTVFSLSVGASGLSNQFNSFRGTSDATKGLVSGLTKAVNMFGGQTAASAGPRTRKFAKLSSKQILEGLRADFEEEEYLWSGKITPELYDEDCVFTDPTLSFRGLSTFEANLANLDPYIERLVPAGPGRRCELRAIRLLPSAGRSAPPVVEAEWRMVGRFALPWRPVLDLGGRTRYTLAGEGGRISSYDESWAISAGEALRQLVTPYAGDDADGARGARSPKGQEQKLQPQPRADVDETTPQPEHWPGRLEGKAAPRPLLASCLTAADGPMPVVILPGFGNALGDYVAPLAQPDVVGLAACLRRRGFSDVTVCPVDRSDWLRVLGGLLDPSFWAGNATVAGPAFRWYTERAQKTIEEAQARVAAEGSEGQGDESSGSTSDGRVLVIGHSAGGWLARATMLQAGPAWARQNVLCLATLGTPHAAPPPGVPDMTRGVLVNLNAAAPGAALAGTDGELGCGVGYVTVAGDAIAGDAQAPRSSPESIAFGSYEMVCGEGQGVKGDGVVPVCAAHLGPRSPDAAVKSSVQLTLPGVLHSINEAGTTEPTDRWYGAEPAMDAWMPLVLKAARSSVAMRRDESPAAAASAWDLMAGLLGAKG
eukprot:CAMPEP_0172632430 /NCGR_PEP_ID=MMETSP1068-20121228/184317_1 /TAXON_ID=35684 /ORGANISM="Pseudopedinella elastica, Strain CCMP716" /LENGTH=599 /DNA_ID=CAMNT_0013443829 /DNA_START=97 /DNA_END=1896 /DNA_ORIENTATION=+